MKKLRRPGLCVEMLEARDCPAAVGYAGGLRE